ncbi:MAG: hypothetical protein CVU04_05820 [Bacteroidetes bacterium HGW-Bacteroidetes-20]|nr:MAG: hypothetical protein CVU04_05820 [Bacteroidetes bacterium HGW-Bacteroidetes-20]
MAGVDTIYSMGNIQNSETKLVKKIATKASVKKWSEVYIKTKVAFDTLKNDATNNEINDALDNLKHKISQLLFSLKTNSGILTFNNFSEIKYQNKLPLELVVPLKMLFESIQTKGALLPVVRFETEKTDVRRFIEILESKEFYSYKTAQSEIEQNITLSNKTIKLIEKAGKDLYHKNSNQLNLRENFIKAIPLSSKIIELFFGKLPGILTEFSGSIVGDYLKINKSIPIYYCEPVLDELHETRIKHKVLKLTESKK